MFMFCFNDCIPQNHPVSHACTCLENTVRAYNKLAEQFPHEVDGVVASYAPHLLKLRPEFSLSSYINGMSEQKWRRYAYSIFKKHPHEAYYAIDNEDELIEGGYYTTVNGDSYSAINLMIVSRNNGILFSLALHNDLRKNQIPVFADGRKVADVDNLYGDVINTDYISSLVRQSIEQKSGNFERLLLTIGENKFSDRFRKNFGGFPPSVQQAIISHFAEAQRRSLPTPFAADDSLIKDVTPKKETSIKVFELRVFDPVACRVYFYETPKCIYLGSVENKPNKKTQSSHIITAQNSIKELIAL